MQQHLNDFQPGFDGLFLKKSIPFQRERFSFKKKTKNKWREKRNFAASIYVAYIFFSLLFYIAFLVFLVDGFLDIIFSY